MTVDPNSTLKVGNLKTVNAVKFLVSGSTATLESRGLSLPPGNYPFPGNSAAIRFGTSMLVKDRAKLLFAATADNSTRFEFAHTPSEFVSFEGVMANDGGLDLNRGTVEFLPDSGAVLPTAYMQVAGSTLIDLGLSPDPNIVEPDFLSNERELGIGQLVIGTPTEPMELILTRSFDSLPTLYLWGFNDGQPDYNDNDLSDDGDGGPIVDSLVIHSGSKLIIPETIDVVYYDRVLSEYIHINALFGGGSTIPFDGGTIELIPPVPGDFDGDLDVDGFDFLKWQRGMSPMPLSQTDLNLWEMNYGMVAPLAASSTAVPEPTAPACGCDRPARPPRCRPR